MNTPGDSKDCAKNSAAEAPPSPMALDVLAIQKLIPHRYPFLFVDRVLEFQDNHRILVTKNVSANEPFFQGHFPTRPVMPGVLILEAMAQAAAILSRLSTEGVPADKMMYLVGANDVRWKKQVVPGDTLHIEMTFERKRRPMWFLKGRVTVDGKLVAEGTITAAEV